MTGRGGRNPARRSLPLQEDGRRRGDDYGAHSLAQQELAGDESCLDGLAEADVVGDEEVHARKEESLAQRLELVGVELNAGAKGRLEELRVGRRDSIPPDRAHVGREQLRRIEAALGDAVPRLGAESLGIDLTLPQNLERLALSVVVDAAQPNQMGIVRLGWSDDFLDEVLARTNTHNLVSLGGLGDLGHERRASPR